VELESAMSVVAVAILHVFLQQDSFCAGFVVNAHGFQLPVLSGFVRSCVL